MSIRKAEKYFTSYIIILIYRTWIFIHADYIFPGLTAATRDLRGYRHVTAMADYALRLREQLQYVNEHSFNSFRIRIGKTFHLNGKYIYIFYMYVYMHCDVL